MGPAAGVCAATDAVGKTASGAQAIDIRAVPTPWAAGGGVSGLVTVFTQQK
jgi:hypothetical protein